LKRVHGRRLAMTVRKCTAGAHDMKIPRFAMRLATWVGTSSV